MNNSIYHSVETYIEQFPPEEKNEVALSKSLIESFQIGLHQEDKITSHGDDLIVVDEGAVWIYKNKHWKRLKKRVLEGLAQAYDGKLTIPLLNSKGEYLPHKIRLKHSNTTAIANAVLVNHFIQREDYFLNGARGIATTSGFWHVEKGKVLNRPNRPNDRCCHLYDIKIQQNAPTKWLTFLDGLFRDDTDKQDKILALREWLGGALLGISPQYARAILLTGSANNGKSVFLKAVEALFPKALRSAMPPSEWADKNSSEYNLYKMRDSRLNVASELPNKKMMERSDIFKKVTTGDTVSCRQIREAPIEIQIKAGHLFSCNELPDTADNTEGFFRRFLIIGLERDFTGDPERRNEEVILKELKAERGAILYWALEGACGLVENDCYTIPESHHGALKEWKQSNDMLSDFLASATEAADTEDMQNWSTLKGIWDAYQTFKDRNSTHTIEDPVDSIRKLNKGLKRLGVKSRPSNSETKVPLFVKQQVTWQEYH